MTFQKKNKGEEFFTSPRGHVRDRIIIQESSEIPKEGLFFSLNGYAFLAKPGVEIDLPRPVRKMLDTRIRTESITGQDGKVYTKDIHRINYILIQEDVDSGKDETEGGASMPSPEAIALAQGSVNSRVDFP